MASTFYVPEQYGGKTLSQLQKETGFAFRPDVFGNLTGIDPNTPLTSGQSLNIRNDPGAGEFQFASRYFTPQAQYQQQQQDAFLQGQQQKYDAFTGKLGEIPTQLEAVRQSLGIPEAYETFRSAGQTARDIGGFVEDLPDSVRQALEGKGLSAGQISGRTSRELRELSPTLTAAQRGLESAGTGLSSLLSQYGTETANIYKPLEMEAQLLSAQSAQEFDLFKQQMSNQLSLELQNLQNISAQELARLQQSGALAQLEKSAELEEKYGNVSYQSLGTTLGVFKGTDLVNQVPITRFGSSGSNLQNYLSPQMSPAGGEGSVQGNYMFINGQWIPIR